MQIYPINFIKSIVKTIFICYNKGELYDKNCSAYKWW